MTLQLEHKSLRKEAAEAGKRALALRIDAETIMVCKEPMCTLGC